MPRMELFIPGEPVPKGSYRAFVVEQKGQKPRAVITNNDTRTKPWQLTVRNDIQNYWEGPPLLEPVAVVMEFRLKRPAYHYRTGKFSGQLKKSAPEHCCKKPDVDKLARTILDAMDKIVYVDDSQVTYLIARKCYSESPGLYVLVQDIESYCIATATSILKNLGAG